MTLLKVLVLGMFLILIQTCQHGEESVKPLLNAHAHNDYNHQRPLFDALSNGFISIEADIHLLHDSLFVAHDSIDIKKSKTLQSLYLDPLKKCITGNNFVYGDSATLILLIDIKTDSLKTYIRLHEILEEYKDMLTIYNGNKQISGAISVIISGNRPIKYIKSQKTRYAAIDGRFDVLGSKDEAFFFPLVSENWNNYFSWNGEGAMPQEEKVKLQEIINSLHNNGQMLRFWATPDSESIQRENVWNELLAAGVDLIGSDDLNGLSIFLKNYQK
ncbi:MAG: phosphatidylinositol-specific phospholipase C/glycerophosphodiester phosphodiesterase family protein [Calditrichaeota bacterium]|nr:phosphatidylinositol-specific phospholipase C/glycerophosphodiester phosphodiesterase family protein [Calditrichota bacterium]